MNFNETKLRHWREAVLRKGRHKCSKCGSTSHLEAHHIKQKSLHPSLAYNVSNGRVLCHKCHMKLHKKIGFGKHSYKEIYYKYISKHKKRVEFRTGRPSSRIKSIKLTYRIVKSTKVSHNWRRPRR